MLKMTLVEESTQRIHKMIVAHEYGEDGYLPSEGDLSQMFGFSRATIREAVRSLEVRGLVKRIHGKGVMVTDGSVSALTQSFSDVMSLGDCDMFDLIEVRHIIETAAARRATQKATQEDIAVMREVVAAMEGATRMDEAYIQNDLNFHIAMVRTAKNRLLTAIVEAYIPLLKDTIIAASQSDYVIEQKHHFHRNILDAIIAGAPDLAEAYVNVHLVATERNVTHE